MSLTKKKLTNNIKNRAKKRFSHEKAREKVRLIKRTESAMGGKSQKRMFEDMLRKQMLDRFEKKQEESRRIDSTDGKTAISPSDTTKTKG
jgi:hypothetical protein